MDTEWRVELPYQFERLASLCVVHFKDQIKKIFINNIFNTANIQETNILLTSKFVYFQHKANLESSEIVYRILILSV